MSSSNGRFWSALGVMLLAVLFFAGVCFYKTTAAHAETMCAKYKELQAALLEHEHEQPTGAGITGGGKVAMTLFASPKGETWTLVAVGVDGVACIIGAGQAWSDLSERKGNPT